MNKTSLSAKAKGIIQLLVRAMRHIILHNGWVKLLSVLISLVLWAGLISQDDSLTREKTWQNVNVTVSGTETMKRNKYIVVSDLDEILNNVSITAAVPQKQYEQAESSAYNLRLDLSRINGTGIQELKILNTTSNVYGRVTKTTPATVQLEVEEYMARPRIPVSVGDHQSGWYKEWYLANPSVDPELIAVSGPRSIVQNISRAKVFLNLDQLKLEEGLLLTSGEIKLFNRSGDEVDSSLLDITTESLTIDSVLVEVNVFPTKTFSVSDMVEYQGELQNGYRIVSKKVSPESISVAARSEVLNQLNELPMDRNINLQELSETTVFQLKVQKPSDDAVLSNDTVTVTVEISAEEI